MEATATLSQYRQAPRKVRLVANLIKGRTVEFALLELGHKSKRAAPVFEKLIRSAVANAKMRGLDEKTLTVKEIRVDKGPVLKRSRPRAHGRAFPIHKHTSHIVVTLTDVPKIDKKSAKVAAASDVSGAKQSLQPKKDTEKAITKKKAANAK